MTNKLASLCILAYKRLDRLKDCIESIHETIDFPCEIIVNLDGGDRDCFEYLTQQYKENKISKLILINGKNRGVGISQANCFKVAEGDYIFKIDTDLTFKKGWLSQSVDILENNPNVGAVGLFNYRYYDPNDTRFNIIKEEKNHLIVDDFVSSVYGFREEDLFEEEGFWYSDDGFHTRLKDKHKYLAITKENFAFNSGFGIGNSVYVTGTMDNPRKTETFDKPLIYG